MITMAPLMGPRKPEARNAVVGKARLRCSIRSPQAGASAQALHLGPTPDCGCEGAVVGDAKDALALLAAAAMIHRWLHAVADPACWNPARGANAVSAGLTASRGPAADGHERAAPRRSLMKIRFPLLRRCRPQGGS